MPRAAPMLASFNAGELSPMIEGRVEVGKYANGCKKLEGYIPTIQGPAKRRGGTRFVAEVKDSSAQTWLIRFEFNTAQAYMLEIGNQYARFYTNHGQVQVSGVAAYNGATAYTPGDLVSQAGVNYYCIAAVTGTAPPNATYWYPLTGTIYEIPTPWTSADLTAADGTFNLRLTESADIVYLVHQNYAPRKLSRLGNTRWVMSTLTPLNGPFQTINSTATTVYASAQTGTGITVIASSGIFTANMVGSLFYIGQRSVLGVAQWEAGKAVGAGARRRSNGVNYVSLNAATTGGNKPIHTSGAVYDGDTGVQWQYEDPGYGYVKITGFTSATQVTADVINPIPFYAVGVGFPTANWAFGAWSDAAGWPSQVSFYKERLVFGRGQNVWLSVSGDYENYAAKDALGVVSADRAISLVLQSDKVNNLGWFASSDALLCGTAGGEFAVQSITTNLPFGPDNVTAPMVSAFGSRAILPSRIGEAVVFVQRSGIKLRDIVYDFVSNQFKSTDQNALADHITAGGVLQMIYQQEPYSVIWAIRADGQLIAMTYSREQYEQPPYGGWHRHPIGGSYGSGPAIVEALGTIPAPAGDRDEMWLIVKRTINGSTKRYIEYIDYERRVNDDPQDSFYVDCGATLNNTVAQTLTPGTGATVAGTTGVTFTAGGAAFVIGDIGREIHYRYYTLDSDGYTRVWATAKALITGYTSATVVSATILVAFPSTSAIAASGWRMTVTTVSGLSWLEGQTVDILGDGAVIPSQTVSSGAITLPTACSKVQIGLPFRTRLQTMRLNGGASDGTSQGKTARINKAVIRFLESLGCKFGPSFSELDEIDFRVVADAMDNAPALFTGDQVIDFPAGYSTDPWVCIDQPQPLPSTIVGVMPIVSVYDRS